MASSLSQGLVLTTAMVVSSTVLYLVFSRQKMNPQFQIHGNPNSQDSTTHILRPCLYSEEKKRERKKKKKKKRVQFAESVKEASEVEVAVAGEEKQGKRNRVVARKCRHETAEIRGIPANRIALYNGILRDRVHRTQCSY